MLVLAPWHQRAAVGSAGEELRHVAVQVGVQPGQERREKGSKVVAAASLLGMESGTEWCLLLGDSVQLWSSISRCSSFLGVC